MFNRRAFRNHVLALYNPATAEIAWEHLVEQVRHVTHAELGLLGQAMQSKVNGKVAWVAIGEYCDQQHKMPELIALLREKGILPTLLYLQPGSTEQVLVQFVHRTLRIMPQEPNISGKDQKVEGILRHVLALSKAPGSHRRALLAPQSAINVAQVPHEEKKPDDGDEWVHAFVDEVINNAVDQSLSLGGTDTNATPDPKQPIIKELNHRRYHRLGQHIKSNFLRYFLGTLVTALVLALCFSPLGPLVFAGLPVVGAALAVAAGWVTSVGIGGYFAAVGIALVAGFLMFHLDRVVGVLLFSLIEIGKGIMSIPGKILNGIAKPLWMNVQNGGGLGLVSGIVLFIIGFPAIITGLLAKAFEWLRQIRFLHDVVMEVRGNADKMIPKIEPETFSQRCMKTEGGIFGVLSVDTGCYLRETMTPRLFDENSRGMIKSTTPPTTSAKA